MPTQAAQRPRKNSTWRSLSLSDFATGYAVHEAASRFLQERLAEHALRLAGAFIMLAGYVHWFLPGLTLDNSSVQMRLALTVLFVVMGVALYVFASRGFRRMLHIDFGNRRLSTARMNSKNQSRYRRDFPMQDVASIYVRRSGSGAGMATLNIRLKSQPQDVALLTGALAEVESLHERLCRDLHVALECVPKRVRPAAQNVYKPRKRPARRRAQPQRGLVLAAE